MHGGAQALVPPAAELARLRSRPPGRSAWPGERREEAIAERAAELVTPGSTVFLDSSSSALVLARRLMDDPPNELTLVTLAAIAYEMQAEPVHVVVAPGELDQHMKMLAGRWTVEFLSQLNFDVAFVSCAGVTLEEGLTTARRPLADVISRPGGRPAHGRVDRLDQVRARVAARSCARTSPT